MTDSKTQASIWLPKSKLPKSTYESCILRGKKLINFGIKKINTAILWSIQVLNWCLIVNTYSDLTQHYHSQMCQRVSNTVSYLGFFLILFDLGFLCKNSFFSNPKYSFHTRLWVLLWQQLFQHPALTVHCTNYINVEV